MNIMLHNNMLCGRLAKVALPVFLREPSREAKRLIYSTLPPPRIFREYIDNQIITNKHISHILSKREGEDVLPPVCRQAGKRGVHIIIILQKY